MIDLVDFVSSCFPWMLPLMAVVGLSIARHSKTASVRMISERAFLALLLVVGGGTLRTIASNDPHWLLHTSSLAIMIVGAMSPGGAIRPSFDGIG